MILVERHVLADGDRERADALGVAGGVAVARVERHGQRADGADVGTLRFLFSGTQRGHHVVEGAGKAVDLAARPALRQRRVEGADLAHVGQRPGERVDRAGECTGQPDAREAGQGERRKRHEEDRPARLAQRRRGGFVDRVEDVDAGVRLAQQFADRILGAADPRDPGQGQAPQRGGVQLRRHRVRQRRGQHL